MWYWIVMFILIAGSIAMLGVSFSSIRRIKPLRLPPARNGRRRRRDEDIEDEEEYDETPRQRRRREAEAQEAQERRPRKKKRQWKVILEDIDSWDKYSFTFYDSVGIGRGKDGSMFEKYLPILGRRQGVEDTLRDPSQKR